MALHAIALENPEQCPACRSGRVRTTLVSPGVGVDAICDACGVGWQESPDKRPSPVRPLKYPSGLRLVPDAPRHSRPKTLWTRGEWRCERDGLTLRLYRKDYIANALTVPDEHHARQCATQWFESVPAARRAPAPPRRGGKKQ